MDKNLFNDDDRLYLQMLQENITRMASNSANCKTWSITIVAAFFALGLNMKELNIICFIAVGVLILFLWHLDTFYLNLERMFRNRELYFLITRNANSDNDSIKYIDSLYNFKPLKKDVITEQEMKQGFVLTNDRFFSKSTCSFYLPILVIIILIGFISNFCSIVESLKYY